MTMTDKLIDILAEILDKVNLIKDPIKRTLLYGAILHIYQKIKSIEQFLEDEHANLYSNLCGGDHDSQTS